MKDALSRRGFLLNSFTGVSAAWVTSHWPAVLASANHAHAAARSAIPPKFEFFTPEQAAEIDAITSRIIPTDETPGAREAGVVYFIDRALKTFASDHQKIFSEGLPELQARAHEMYPDIDKFSAATPEQQDAILHSLDKDIPAVERPFRPSLEAQSFFEILRSFTIQGFLIDPESDKRGNREGVGWKVIGRDREHMFQPPFGYYDKDYPGWQPPSTDAEKK